MIVKIRFIETENGKKVYSYFWPENRSIESAGTKLLIKTRYGPSKVEIVGYNSEDNDPLVDKIIDIIKILKTSENTKFIKRLVVTVYELGSEKEFLTFLWPQKRKELPVGTLLEIYDPINGKLKKVSIISYTLLNSLESDLYSSILIKTIFNFSKTIKDIESNKGEKQMNKTFDRFDRFKETAKNIIDENKDIIIKTQKGKAVIAAIKTGLLETPVVPDKIKDFLKIPGYSDIVIGMGLSVLAETFTDNKTICNAVESANFVGAIEFSGQFTMIEKMIESTIIKALGKVTPDNTSKDIDDANYAE